MFGVSYYFLRTFETLSKNDVGVQAEPREKIRQSKAGSSKIYTNSSEKKKIVEKQSASSTTNAKIERVKR